MQKPILVALSQLHPNPPLWPEPIGSTGWKIWRMIHHYTACTPKQYIRTFDRMLLSKKTSWDFKDAVANAPAKIKELEGRENVIIFGQYALRALGLFTKPKFFEWKRSPTGFRYMMVPGIGGRGDMYKEKKYLLMTSALLTEL